MTDKTDALKDFLAWAAAWLAVFAFAFDVITYELAVVILLANICVAVAVYRE